MSRINDVFSWIYDNLKGFDQSLFQHTIDLSSDVKPIRQKQRPTNPKIGPMMRKDISKMTKANIIFPIKHSCWYPTLFLLIRSKGLSASVLTSEI